MKPCPTLADLLPPPSGKSGWPWTDETLPLPYAMPDGSPWPKISIVTPSFNQGQYIEETIRSVLLQGYPNLEYIIIDGGSTDGSVDIIKKYEPWLTYWVSEPDRGQSHAINKGWEKTTGDIIAYLNSDDFYVENSLVKVASHYKKNKKISAVIGRLWNVNQEGNKTNLSGIPYLPFKTLGDLSLYDPDLWFLPQASAFWFNSVLEISGKWVREDLHFTMDRELFYRTCKLGEVVVLDEPLAFFRYHVQNKSMFFTLKMYREDMKALKYIMDENFLNNLIRFRNGVWWLSRGHFFYSKRTKNYFSKILHFFLSIILRPGKLFSKNYIKYLLRILIPNKIFEVINQ